MNAPVSRRALLQAGSAALGAVVVPGGIGAPVAADPFVSALQPAFDPAGYVADLEAIGCRVALAPPIRVPGRPSRWTYSIGSPRGEGFGDDFRDVMERWSGAVTACPDHGARVAAFLAGRTGVAS